MDDCLNDIAKRFTGFDPAKQKVVDCDGLPVKNDKGVSMNPFDLMLSGSEDSFKYKEPEFPVKAMAERGRKTDALTMADIVKAIQAAYIQIQAKTLREEQQMRAQCFYSIVETTGRQRMEQVKAMVAERGAIMKEQAEKLANFELMDWTEEDVINASMNKVNFDIAAAKLGPKGQMVVQLLQEKLGNEVDPSVTSALVDVAKDLGAAGLDKGTGVLVDKLGAKVPDILPELKGNFLSQLNEACVNFDPNALNFGAMLEGGKDEAMAKLPISPEMKGAATKMLDELLDQGTLSTEAFDELMAGGVDSLLDGGVDMMLEKLQKKLPKGMKLNEDDVSGLKDMALAGDVDGMLDMGADMAEDMAGAAAMSMVSKSKAGKAMLALDKKMANNPVLGALYKEMKGQMAGAGKDCLDQIMNMENPSLPLPEFMQDMSLPSLDSLEGALDGMGDSIADALENANFEVLEEAVLGMELDMSMDFEALIEALEEARDALVSILEFLDMDVV